MADVELMALPPISPTAPDARPQMFLLEGRQWRNITPVEGDVFSRKTYQAAIETYLDDVMQQIGVNAAVDPRDPGFWSEFAGFYNDLMPINVRDHLASILGAGGTPVLVVHVHQETEWIPWELLHDGTDYLGLRMQIVRIPITKHGSVAPPAKRDNFLVHNLLGNQILDAALTAKWEQTFAAVLNGGQAMEKRCPDAAAGTFASVAQLKEADKADIIHITCHGGLRNTQNMELYWTLDHTSAQKFKFSIDRTRIDTLNFTKQPLVFGNACSAAQAGVGERGALMGFGGRFLSRGALNFIGTVAPISQDTAIDFATAFYRNLLTSAPARPIGAALLATKQEFVAANKPDPSYLFYCLYGPHDVTYQPTH